MKETIHALSKQLDAFGAAESHITYQNIEKKKGRTAVVGVYENIKPPHMVLEELYEWAEEHDDQLRQRIEQLETDMSWASEEA